MGPSWSYLPCTLAQVPGLVCCSDGVSVIDWNIQYELWAEHKLLCSNFTSSIKYLVITCSTSNNSFATKTGG